MLLRKYGRVRLALAWKYNMTSHLICQARLVRFFNDREAAMYSRFREALQNETTWRAGRGRM